MNRPRFLQAVCMVAASAICVAIQSAAASPVNLVQNGSFEGTAGTTPSGWSVGGTAMDGYLPVAITYNNHLSYPNGAQGELVPTDDAMSASPDAAGLNGVYFVSDQATNLSLSQTVYLTPGSYAIGFDSYDTYNGRDQPLDANLSAEIAGVDLADFDLSTVSPGKWTTHAGEATITTAGNYLVSFVFNTPSYPDHPDNAVPYDQRFNAKDVVIDRAYVLATTSGVGAVIPVPLPAGLPMFAAGLVALGAVGHGLRRRVAATAA